MSKKISSVEEDWRCIDFTAVVWEGQDQGFHQFFLSLSISASQMLMFTAYLAVVVALYLVPLTISSPCIMEKKALGPKPAIIGHRGAPMVSSLILVLVVWFYHPLHRQNWLWWSPGCSPDIYDKYTFKAPLLARITSGGNSVHEPRVKSHPRCSRCFSNKRPVLALLRVVCATASFWLLVLLVFALHAWPLSYSRRSSWYPLLL